MPKATKSTGELAPLEDCYIDIPQLSISVLGNPTKLPAKIVMTNLPEISDTKSASYVDESTIGRSSPFKGYSHSENRTISWTCHFIVCKESDKEMILNYIRLLEACTYPLTNADSTGGAPFAPPPICHLKCGRILGENYLCAVLKSYQLKFDTTVPWDDFSYLPYKIDVDLQFDVVYNQSELPGAELIMDLG
jgi:hypothetical protein